ncbi:MAG: GNAT family N-acetyltransferase [Halosimplex sp.]
MTDDISVRPAIPGDLTGVLGVLDAAALETDADRIRASIDRGETFVAVRDGPGSGPDDGSSTVLGALVLVDAGEATGDAGEAAGDDDTDTVHIDAAAVRRRRRGRGIGTELIAAAADRHDRLVGEFDPGVRPFYESLGFAVEPIAGTEGERYRGELSGEFGDSD